MKQLAILKSILVYILVKTQYQSNHRFFRRNFTVELAAEKLVRLVFNGHVLQPDSKTLRACGLFDNCVVHCLVHNKKPSVNNDGDNNNATQGKF